MRVKAFVQELSNARKKKTMAWIFMLRVAVMARACCLECAVLGICGLVKLDKETKPRVEKALSHMHVLAESPTTCYLVGDNADLPSCPWLPDRESFRHLDSCQINVSSRQRNGAENLTSQTSNGGQSVVADIEPISTVHLFCWYHK